MARARVELKLPERALRQMLKLYGEDALAQVKPVFSEAASDAMASMVELAPFETGHLESSAQLIERVTPRGRRARAEFAFTAEYASIVHELPEHSRGAGTRAKPGNEFGAAGPKYIERVLRRFKLGPRVAQGLRDFWSRQRKVR